MEDIIKNVYLRKVEADEAKEAFVLEYSKQIDLQVIKWNKNHPDPKEKMSFLDTMDNTNFNTRRIKKLAFTDKVTELYNAKKKANRRYGSARAVILKTAQRIVEGK